MPQRHSRNNNDLAIFTYEEKRKLGFGTQRERIGKDSLKPFDVCCLCLKPFVDPLSCRSGHIYCKECIYTCILQQKKDIKRKQILFQEQERDEKEDLQDSIEEEKERQLELFDKQNNSAVPNIQLTERSRNSGGFHGANSVKATSFEEEALRTMKAYWLPSATPQATHKLEAPNTDTLCPEGSEKLKIRDLFSVIFTEVPREEENSQTNLSERYMCPSCSTTLTNASKLTALTACGHVFCKKCADKFVKPEKRCTACEAACRVKDMVDLQQGGTGFAGHGDKVVAAAFKHLGSGSGAAVLRPVTKI